MERWLAHLLVPQRPVGSPEASLAESSAILVLRGAKELRNYPQTAPQAGDLKDRCLLLLLQHQVACVT